MDHLFRREAGKLVAYLTRILGYGRLDLAEDVVQDTLCRAMETWSLQGVPENPSAWLMRVARNRAIDLVRRDDHFRYFIPELQHLLKLGENVPEDTPAFAREIQDDQLRMMFACCHPELSTEAQVTLILKTLCGFSVAEIAHALLAGEDSIEKRLGRARKLFRDSGAPETAGAAPDVSGRLEAVYQAIYLLFNEGYHGSQSEQTVREELCFEAIRLGLLLGEHPEANRPQTRALLALMCFHAAHVSGRVGAQGDLLQWELQDRSGWDKELMTQGFKFLEQAMTGNELSAYHLEAGIAALHCAASTCEETDWNQIAGLYDSLFALKPSPIVALNRAIALGIAQGPERGLAELDAIPHLAMLRNYPFYPAARGEFLMRSGSPAEAIPYFEEAAKLARTQTEAKFFQSKVAACRPSAANAG